MIVIIAIFYTQLISKKIIGYRLHYSVYMLRYAFILFTSITLIMVKTTGI